MGFANRKSGTPTFLS